MNPFVSVIIPCRNEEKFISKCLDSIINNNYLKESLEVFIIDGASEDKTREIINQYLPKYSFLKFFENPGRFAPLAQNIGVKNSKGEIIIIMDAHVTYQEDYISKCVKYLKEYDADDVGGVLITTPAENNIIAKTIANVLSNRFGVGNSYFRTGTEKPKWVDTVPYGCYKKEVFDKIGLYNEKMLRSYDMDFNLRLKKAGGKILLAPDIVGYYYPKSNFTDFFLHNFEDGIWITYPLKFKIKAFRLRHLIPLFFVSSLIFFFFFFPPFFSLITSVYFLVDFYFSFKIARKEKNWDYLPLMMVAFAIRHIGYGAGSIWGFVKILVK